MKHKNRLLQRLAKLWHTSAAKSQHQFFSTSSGMLTHTPAKEYLSLEDIEIKLTAIQEGLKNNAKLSDNEKIRLSVEAEQLSQTELGRFFIENKGALSGWWTYYCILGYKKYKITNSVEQFILEKAPTVLATRERFGHFQQVMQSIIEKNSHISRPIKLASVPGGMSADLLTLPAALNPARCHLQFINIDLDSAVFTLAQKLADELQCKIPIEYRCEDARKLKAQDEFDVVASNGLNIYVPEREKVIALFESLLKILNREAP